MSKKSQLAMGDFIVALVIATLMLMVIMFTWNRYTIVLDENTRFRNMESTALQAADLLVKSPGSPIDWETDISDIQIIGLAVTNRNISLNKLNSFANINYNRSLKLLGLELYNFDFSFSYANGTTISQHGKSTNGTIININRIVRFQNEDATLKISVWK
jgi:hypothetical protein